MRYAIHIFVKSESGSMCNVCVFNARTLLRRSCKSWWRTFTICVEPRPRCRKNGTKKRFVILVSLISEWCLRYDIYTLFVYICVHRCVYLYGKYCLCVVMCVCALALLRMASVQCPYTDILVRVYCVCVPHCLDDFVWFRFGHGHCAACLLR